MKSEKINRLRSHYYDFKTSKNGNRNNNGVTNQRKSIDHLKVMIIDEHRLFADGIRNLIGNYDKNIETEYAQNIMAASELTKDLEAPDLILLSINNSAFDNIYSLIRKHIIETPVMILSAIDSLSAVEMAIDNNVSGYISKNSSREDILEAILSVLDGNIYISKPKQQTVEARQNTGTEKITKRQHQVLRLLSKGLLNKQIAWELEISENTVKAHLSDLFKHLHVTNRTAAVKSGYEYGLII